MKKECTCKKLVKDDKVTLITECELCKKNRRKDLKLFIELFKSLADIAQKPVPEYKKDGLDFVQNTGKETIITPDGKQKKFQEAWNEVKPKKAIDAMEEQIKKDCSESIYIDTKFFEKFKPSIGDILKATQTQCNHEYIAVGEHPIFNTEMSAMCRKCGYRP